MFGLILESLYARIAGFAAGLGLIAYAIVGQVPEPWWGLLVVVGSVVAVLAGFLLIRDVRDHWHMKTPDQPKKRKQSQTITTGSIYAPVGSIGQSGGTTIQNVTAPPQRSFQSYDLAELRNYLAQFAGTTAMMAWGGGDGEAEAFAHEIRTLLVSAGWKVDRYRSVLGIPTPPAGVSLRFAGLEANAPAWIAGFRDRLAAWGFVANGVPDFYQTEIYVGRL
jgi:hypothetical protein